MNGQNKDTAALHGDGRGGFVQASKRTLEGAVHVLPSWLFSRQRPDAGRGAGFGLASFRASRLSRPALVGLPLMVLWLAGCAGGPKKSEDSGRAFASGSRFSMSIESDPPGARIFWSSGANEAAAKVRNYIGSTPCVWEGECLDDHTFNPVTRIAFYNRAVKAAVVVEADPPAGATNQWPQRQVFRCSAAFQHGDQVPAKLFFDLTKHSPALPAK